MEESFIIQKFIALFNKHSADGTTPRKLIESNLSREFRLSREECHRLLEGLKIDQAERKKRNARRFEKVNYESTSQDQYYKELKSSQ
jgi:hypothetical protein